MIKQNDLQYGYSDLEPYINTHTLGVHYNYHARNYLKKLRKILKENNIPENIQLDDLLYLVVSKDIKDREDILFNLGGVLNHNLYFESMSKNPVKPNQILTDMINTTFGSFDAFISEFKKNALAIKGSGYTYLVLDDRELKIVNTKNQDCPLFYGLTPLLTLDIWEHAYYLNYENKKDLYVDKFFDIADFRYANEVVLK